MLTHKFWKNEVEKGSFITVKDEIEIQESGNLDGVEYQVQFKRKFVDQDNVGEWLFFYLDNVEFGSVCLVVKMVGEEIDFRVYYTDTNEFFKEGNRQDMIENNQQFIFEEPEDTDNFNSEDPDCLNNLEYTKKMTINFSEEEIIDFEQKPQGVMYGEFTENPSQILDEPTFGSLVEYIALEAAKCTEIMILEIGNADFGGMIIYLEGSQVNINDLAVM